MDFEMSFRFAFAGFWFAELGMLSQVVVVEFLDESLVAGFRDDTFFFENG